MTIFTLFFAILGVSYVSWWIMKFIVWLDGADQVDVDDGNFDLESAPEMDELVVQHRNAA